MTVCNISGSRKIHSEMTAGFIHFLTGPHLQPILLARQLLEGYPLPRTLMGFPDR